MRKTKVYYRGCLIGGAIGDALGWPIEFMSLEEIKSKYGNKGISSLVIGRRGRAEVTDDTQMTLFTAEGLLRGETRGYNKGVSETGKCVYNAYLRWLYTQGDPADETLNIYDGYLIKQKELYVKRAPGMTCLTSLRNREMGTVDNPLNDSKGCGCVMRVAPVGLFYRPQFAFNKGMECSAITHGHITGHLSAGAFAYIIASIMSGMDIVHSVEDTLIELSKYYNSEEIVDLLKKAINLSMSKKSNEVCIKELGQGWIAEEAIGIAVFCALRYKDDFEGAIIAAVNHSGDSDSTGAMTGNIVGAHLGLNKIPRKWTSKLELYDVITKVADDLLTGYSDDGDWWMKYPGY